MIQSTISRGSYRLHSYHQHQHQPYQHRQHHHYYHYHHQHNLGIGRSSSQAIPPSCNRNYLVRSFTPAPSPSTIVAARCYYVFSSASPDPQPCAFHRHCWRVIRAYSIACTVSSLLLLYSSSSSSCGAQIVGSLFCVISSVLIYSRSFTNNYNNSSLILETLTIHTSI